MIGSPGAHRVATQEKGSSIKDARNVAPPPSNARPRRYGNLLSATASMLLLLLLGLAPISHAQPPAIDRGTAVVSPKERVYDLKIISISPSENILEHQPIQIRYQLEVSATNSPVGELKSLRASVCPVSNKGTCDPINDVQLRRYTGTIQAYAPAAGPRMAMTIKLITDPPPCPEAPNCFGETVLASSDDHFVVPVAARYGIAVTEILIEKTRAKFNDTVKISLRSGLAGSYLCDVVGGNFCAIMVSQGDHHANEILNVDNVRVGPFDLIPEVSDNLAFQYDVENFGTSSDQKDAQIAVDTMNQLAAGILDALMKTGNFDKLDSFTDKLSGLNQCDGTVALDAKLILNKANTSLPGVPTLEALTGSTGTYKPRAAVYDGTDSGLGCGVNSKYVVNWAIFRTSWEPQ
jgi:hypothetical protein